MESLQKTQDLLLSNINDKAEYYLNTRNAQIDKLTTWRRKVRVPMPEEYKNEYRESGLQLLEFCKRYAAIALTINPLIVPYNEAIQNNDLEAAKSCAKEIVKAYMDSEFKELRKEVGILKLKKHIWMKIDVPLRKDLYRKMEYAADQLVDARKMSKRVKRLDVKTVYPYWLW